MNKGINTKLDLKLLNQSAWKIIFTIALCFIFNTSFSQNNYCIPTPANGVNGHSIDHIKLESLDTAFSGATYQYFSSRFHHETCFLIPGRSYKIYMTSGTHAVSTLAAWIDWNNDIAFGTSEKLGEFITTTANQIDSISFTVPLNAATGKNWLRIRSSNSTSINSCNSYSSGETVDFNITILNPFYEYNFFPNWEYSGNKNYFLDGVIVNSIDNQGSGGTNGPVYSDYTNLITFINECSFNYIYILGNFSSSNDSVFAFLDYNNNGIFEDNELLGNTSVPSGYNLDSIYFSPPSIAGDFRLRVLYHSNSKISEVEDYSISIINSIASYAPTSHIGSDLFYSCGNNCFYYGCVGSGTFYDYSCGIPSYRRWSVPGAIPSSSTSKNPTFNFPNTGIYNITLIDTNVYGSDTITVKVNISSSVTNINLGSNKTICSGDSILLSAPAGNPLTDCYSYLWSTGATTREIYVRQSGTYSVKLSSCYHKDCPAYDTIVINLSPSKYNVTGGGSYCIGGSAPNVGLNDSELGIIYRLYKNGTFIGSPVTGTGNAISFGTQSSTGTYTVIATNTTLSCTLSMNGNVTVNLIQPPTTFHVSGGGNYCAGGNGVSVIVDSSEINVNYQLYRNGNTTGTPKAGTGNSISFLNNTTVGNYTVVATANNSTCITPMLDTAKINTTPGPAIFNVSGGGTFCGGSPSAFVRLNDSKSSLNYELYKNGTPTGIVISGTDTIIIFSQLTSSGNYTIVATDSLTCKSTMSGSANLTIIPAPIAFTLSGGGNYCSGQPIDSIKLSGSEVWVRYQLYVDGTPVGNSLNGNGNILNYGVQSKPGTYYVIGSNTITACYDTMAGIPVITFGSVAAKYNLTGGGHYCNGELGVPVGLSNSETNFKYQLIRDNVPVNTPIQGTGSPLNFGIQNIPGIYTVNAISADTSCTSSMNDSVTIFLDQLPSPNVITLLPDTICNTHSPISLAGSPPGGILSGDGVVNDTLFPLTTGVENVIIYYDYTDPVTGCSAYTTKNVYVDICNSIEEYFSQETISLFPNPADNELTISFYLKYGNNFSIDVYNSIGQIIYSDLINKLKGLQSYKINTTAFSDGFYIIKFNFKNKIFTNKIIIHHSY